MNKAIAIAFLKAHQPMPDDDILDEELINKYDEVREFFLAEPSEECIPLFLNSFGEYDGLGVYQLVEDVILKFKHEIVVEHLKGSLRSEHKGVRYWSADIAMYFPDNILIAPLSELLMDEISDIRLAAITALAEIPDLDIIKILTSHLERENDDYVKEFITDIINDRRYKMDKLAPNHVIEYCDNVKQNRFVEIYEKYNDFYHRVYQIKCSCHCDDFRIYMDDCPTVIAECSRCKKRIVLYDLDKYDASEKPSWTKWRSPNKFEYSYNGEALFNICVMYEYSDDFSSYDDLSWFTAWGYNRNIDNAVEIISDETT